MNAQTPEEWQEAVNAAEFLVNIDAARQYGLIKGGPKKINVDRCVEIIRIGKRKGYKPAPLSELYKRYL